MPSNGNGPLVIRPDQMSVFRSAAEARFEQEMVAHCTAYFPEQVAALGPEGLRAVLRHGMARATEYGLDSPYATCAYLNVMFLFGRDFDRDEQLPWAAGVLTDASILDPNTRADELSETALDYLEFLATRGR